MNRVDKAKSKPVNGPFPKESEHDSLRLDTHDFVLTPAIESIVTRSLAYLTSGYSVHLTGPAGTGKTTLAIMIAGELGCPMELIQGDEGVLGSHALGRENGYSRTSQVDNYIHSVVSRREDYQTKWSESRLARACRLGHTLVYDEFNRSPAAANNVLLAALSEGVIALARGVDQDLYLKVHPSFRVILTSNPEEYAGVHETQNALLDRVISITVGSYDRRTEIEIVKCRAEVDDETAALVVDLVGKLRERVSSTSRWPSLRAAIAAARVLNALGGRSGAEEEFFHRICRDVFNPITLKEVRQGDSQLAKDVERTIDDFFK